MNGSPWQVAVIAVLVAVVGLAGASATQSGSYSATASDTTTIQYNTTYSVSEPVDGSVDAYNDTVTITANNTTLEEGRDYQWDASNGSVEWLNSTATSDGDSATIDYGYSAYRQSTTTIHALTSAINPVFGLAFFVVVVGAAWRLAHSGGGGF